jgi:hypothetical protein
VSFGGRAGARLPTMAKHQVVDGSMSRLVTTARADHPDFSFVAIERLDVIAVPKLEVFFFVRVLVLTHYSELCLILGWL